MNVKSTPGPWRQDAYDHASHATEIYAPGFGLIANVFSPAPNSPNARLIAAAPDLLAALARFVGPCEHPSAFGPCEQKSAHWTIIPRDPPCRMCQTHAAIRKATGEGA